MYIDRIDLSIPAEDIQSVMEAFASAAATLEQLPSVGPVDRKRYAKLGLKNEALTRQIIEVGRKNRHLIPAGIDFEPIDRDLVAREQLRTLKIILQGLLDRVSDAMLLTGVDLYAAALSMYHCLRRNADTASLKLTVAELKKGFARPSRKKKEEPAAPTSRALSPEHGTLSAVVTAPASALPEAASETAQVAPPPSVTSKIQEHRPGISLSFPPRQAVPSFFRWPMPTSETTNPHSTHSYISYPGMQAHPSFVFS